MRLRQTLILSLMAAVALALLAPGPWARADEGAVQLPEPFLMEPLGVQATCIADCYCSPYTISCDAAQCSAKDDPDGYVNCGDPIYCSSYSTLTVSLEVTDCEVEGGITYYTLRATADGGCGAGTYYFTWYTATATSGSTVNPNYATGEVHYKQRTFGVQVTSGNMPAASDSITLYPDCQMP